MKSIYSLAFLAAASACSYDDDSVACEIENLLNRVYQETENGIKIDLSPYAVVEFEETDNEIHLRHNWHPLGLEENRFDSEISLTSNGNSYNYNGYYEGYLSSWTPAMRHVHKNVLGLPDLCNEKLGGDHYIFTTDYNLELSAFGLSAGGSSVLGSGPNMESKAEWNFNNNINVEINAGNQESKLFIDIEADSSFVNLHPNVEAQMALGPYELNLEVRGNGQKCMDFFNGKSASHCLINGDLTYDTQNYGSDEIKTFVDLKQKAVIASITLPNKKNHKIVARSENANNVANLWKNQDFVGIYYLVNKNKPLAAIANRRATLIVRLPLMNTLKNDILPLVLEKLEPFMNFVMTLMNESDKIPELLVHLDTFLLDFDNEFDCSEIVETSRIESGLFEEEFNIKMNVALSESCYEFNNMVVDEFFHNGEVSYVMEQLREYGRYLFSDDSLDVHEDTWSGIF